MAIDWNAVATIASPVIALFVGVWVNRRFENRPVLIAYYSHVSAFKYTPPGGLPTGINTHSVVLRNTGRESAKNVRLHHLTLPDFNIWPVIVYQIETLPDGSQDIVFPTLVPGEQVTISYLYLHPLTVEQVNAGIKSEKGFCQQIPVLLRRQYPPWVTFIARTLIIAGIVAILYAAYVGVSAAIR